MDLNTLKKFAQGMRRDLVSQMDARIDYVLKSDDEYLRAHQSGKKRIAELEQAMGRAELVEEAAYLWFNRLAAFRYMDSRGYTSPRVVSPRNGESQPELLAEIKHGQVPAELAFRKAQFDAILAGRIKTTQPDREVYKEALLGTCNAWASRMPWLFSKVDDWASLLLPQDLLSQDSLVARMVAGLSDADCAEGVEIIGWLYQFYISEKKDEVFALLKKNVKISKENIPAATQLFTPHWIVRFMVENSLGRLWLLNRPESGLKDRMKYFVESDPEPDYLKVKDPTELKCLDPCCGSGHILAYYFELLYPIYEEEGYAPAEIPSLIIQKNIYGIDIDERAAELAAFTLAMVAREKDKRFFERGIQPNVIAMRDANVNLKKLGVRLSPDLQESVELLKEGRNYGSLIPVPAGAAGEIHEVEAGIESHRFDDLFGAAELEELKVAFRILEYLEPRYHVMVTNPPYMGSKGMNDTLLSFVERNYRLGLQELAVCFLLNGFQLVLDKGYTGFITFISWMYKFSFKEFRTYLVVNFSFSTLMEIGRGAFGSDFGSASFIFKKEKKKLNEESTFIKLYKKLANVEADEIKIKRFISGEGRFKLPQSIFLKLPTCIIAYFLQQKLFAAMSKNTLSPNYGTARQGIKTGDNDTFLRLWYEISFSVFGSGKKWVSIEKGGDFNKWYGNNWYVVYWENDGKRIKEFYSPEGRLRSRPQNIQYFFKPGITWSTSTIGDASFRYSLPFAFESAGSKIFLDKSTDIYAIIAFLNSNVARFLLSFLSPGVSYSEGAINQMPIIKDMSLDRNIVKDLLSISKASWDLRETSWDFIRSPLICDYAGKRFETIFDECLSGWSWPSAFKVGMEINIATQFNHFNQYWKDLFINLTRNEEKLNQKFIDLYGLGEELTPDVPYKEITILQDELIENSRKDNRIEFNEAVISEQFISYAIGCLMGRYSVEKDGLILADAGATIDDFRNKIPYVKFFPDEDGILPLTDEDDFPDDIPTAFKKWLRFLSGEHFADNLRWIEDRLGKDLRNYFERDFFKDHIKRYKSRPIYWMVSSPSGAFRALIYLHRYTKDTVGKILNDYVRPYRTKIDQKIRGLESIIDSSGSGAGEKTKAKKRLAQLEKYKAEIEAWEKDSLYPLALKRIELDLDDGVKVNYRKLEGILEPVKQLEGKEEE
jgi:SAM-dependent methyltransferase